MVCLFSPLLSMIRPFDWKILLCLRFCRSCCQGRDRWSSEAEWGSVIWAASSWGWNYALWKVWVHSCICNFFICIFILVNFLLLIWNLPTFSCSFLFSFVYDDNEWLIIPIKKGFIVPSLCFFKYDLGDDWFKVNFFLMHQQNS